MLTCVSIWRLQQYFVKPNLSIVSPSGVLSIISLDITTLEQIQKLFRSTFEDTRFPRCSLVGNFYKFYEKKQF